MKTDKRSLASQLGSFFRPSHYAIIFRKHESDILSVSRNLFYFYSALRTDRKQESFFIERILYDHARSALPGLPG